MRSAYGGEVLEYFVRFGNGNYGRFSIMGSAGEYFVDSYLNPDQSPNLEYDPAKRINVSSSGRGRPIQLIYPPADEQQP